MYSSSFYNFTQKDIIDLYMISFKSVHNLGSKYCDIILVTELEVKKKKNESQKKIGPGAFYVSATFI